MSDNNQTTTDAPAQVDSGSSGGLALVGIALAVLVFLGVNLLAGPSLRRIRADLTSQKLFTLSDGTRNILGSLDEPVTLKFFMPKTQAEELAPGLVPYANRVKEMLEQYDSVGGDKVRLEVLDPIPFSEAEDLAATKGLRALPASRQGDALYFGLVGSHPDQPEDQVIAAFDPTQEHKLEFQITELIDKLRRPEKRVIGLIAGLPMRGGPAPPPNQFGQQPPAPQPWPILQFLERSFEVRDLDGATLESIDEDVDVLMLVRPKDLSEKAMYAIDQYALAGGKILAFVDPYLFPSFDPSANPNDPMAAITGLSSGIDPLLASWGLEFERGKVVGDIEHANEISDRSGRPVRMPLVFSVKPETLSDDDVLVSALERLDMLGAAPLRKIDGAPEGLELRRLATTTGDGAAINRSVIGQNLDIEPVVDAFATAPKEEIPLAWGISGRFATAFPGGLEDGADDASGDDPAEETPDDPDGEEAADEPAGDHLEESTEDFAAIVIGDVDMLHADLWGRRTQNFFTGGVTYVARGGNAPLLIGALELLSGSQDLISLRSREPSSRPFIVKEELQRKAEAEFRAKEEELEEKLAETERKLNEMQLAKDPSDALLLSEEQEAAIAQFREEQKDTRKELREVRRNLRAEIDALGTGLAALNIAGIPLLIMLGGLIWALWSRLGSRS